MKQHKKGQEKLRVKIMEMVKHKLKTLKAVALELGISYSQTKRIYQCYLKDGDEALIHGNTDKPSNNKTEKKTVSKAVELYRDRYDDLGSTLAQEILCEKNNLEIGVSTLRRELMKADL